MNKKLMRNMLIVLTIGVCIGCSPLNKSPIVKGIVTAVTGM